MTAPVAAVLAFGFVSMAGLLFLLLRSRFQEGQREEKLRHAKEQDSGLRQAHLLRDRLDYDADFASRVRRRFTR